MAEVVLDELEGHAGIEEVRGDRVPQRVAGEVPRQPGIPAVVNEPGLDLALLERPFCPGKER